MFFFPYVSTTTLGIHWDPGAGPKAVVEAPLSGTKRVPFMQPGFVELPKYMK